MPSLRSTIGCLAVGAGFLALTSPALGQAPTRERTLSILTRANAFGRTVSFRAVGHQPGQLLLWRTEPRAVLLARMELRPGSNDYSFVDVGAGLLGETTYRLTFEGADGAVLPIVSAHVVERRFDQASSSGWASGGSPGPVASLETALDFVPPGPSRVMLHGDHALPPATCLPPEPPPPRTV